MAVQMRVFALIMALAGVPTAISAATAGRSDVLHFLPAGAHLLRAPVWARLARGAPEAAVVFFAYRAEKSPSASAYVEVLKREGAGLRPVWRLDCHGAYPSFHTDSGVYDINHTGRPKIVVDCAGTTVCPNFFGIFQYAHGGIVPVPADFQPLHTCRVKLADLGSSATPEIINYPYGYKLPEIYHWNGFQYARDDGAFPHFWAQYGSSLLGIGKDTHATPIPVLVGACRNALIIFRLARERKKGPVVCAAARGRIADGKALWRYTGQTEEQFKREQENAISAINALLKNGDAAVTN